MKPVRINSESFIFTHHVLKRYNERFMKGSPNQEEVIKELANLIRHGEDNKAIFNDTSFIAYMYERYGYEHKWRFIQDGDVILVCKLQRGVFVVVTTYDATNSSQKHINHKRKLNKNRG